MLQIYSTAYSISPACTPLLYLLVLCRKPRAQSIADFLQPKVLDRHYRAEIRHGEGLLLGRAGRRMGEILHDLSSLY